MTTQDELLKKEFILLWGKAISYSIGGRTSPILVRSVPVEDIWKWVEQALASHHTQILAEVEGVIGEDELIPAFNYDNEVADRNYYRNDLKAEQRHRLTALSARWKEGRK